MNLEENAMDCYLMLDNKFFGPTFASLLSLAIFHFHFSNLALIVTK